MDYCAELPEKILFTIDGCDETFEVESPFTRHLLEDGCDVLGRDTAERPVLIRRCYGKGQLIYLNAPVEYAAVTQECKLFQIYRRIAGLAGIRCPDKAPEIGITHHPLPDGGEIRILIWCNGKEVFRHNLPGSVLPFELKTDLNAGENSIAVKVTSFKKPAVISLEVAAENGSASRKSALSGADASLYLDLMKGMDPYTYTYW